VDELRGAVVGRGADFVVNSGVYGAAKKIGRVVNEKVRFGIFSVTHIRNIFNPLSHMNFQPNGFVCSNASGACRANSLVAKPAVPIDVRVTDRASITK
jgi:hypothetical protein